MFHIGDRNFPPAGRRRLAKSVYEKYGGFSQIGRIVVDFYALVDHQTKFLAMLLGGPASYTDEQIRALHRHLTIEPAHFDTLKPILGETLSDHGVAGDDVARVVGEFESRRGLVVP